MFLAKREACVPCKCLRNRYRIAIFKSHVCISCRRKYFTSPKSHITRVYKVAAINMNTPFVYVSRVCVDLWLSSNDILY